VAGSTGCRPQHNGTYELIDEVFLDKGGGEPGTADGDDACAGLMLQFVDLVSNIPARQPGVAFRRRQAG
jgi:hypothetical protein